MSERSFVVPNISCHHCTRTIERELGELAGVTHVSADAGTKNVIVSWDDTTSWEEIRAVLVEIGYPPSTD
ncbi:MAG: heavy-metal-associated domain-containing protein [Acidobacteria bacterium]|jgi:copper chaperone|nr:heavy-metal-associated domain-containing protein [Acidobacteriota bacterium]